VVVIVVGVVVVGVVVVVLMVVVVGTGRVALVLEAPSECSRCLVSPPEPAAGATRTRRQNTGADVMPSFTTGFKPKLYKLLVSNC
jgi:hypothetical protein